MSCPEFVYTPQGRQGIGVIQPQSGLDYPLVQPSEDIRYLLADFYLSYDDRGEYVETAAPTVFPLRIKYLLNVGCEPNDLPAGAPLPTHEADIVIVDANGTEILNTAAVEATCTVRDWGDNYKIYEWLTPDATCRLVAHTTWKTGEPEPQTYLQHLQPNNAVLDARTIEKLPKRLRSLSVRQRSGTVVNGPYVGNITFKNNYNTAIVAAETTTNNFLVNTRVTLSAVAGSGAGYFPVCGDGYDEETNEPIPQPIKSINGVGPTAPGDFFVSGNDCIYVRRPTLVNDLATIPSPTAQQAVGADCNPCCACSDYVSTARYMNSLRDEYKLIGERVKEVKVIHEANINKWNDKRDCSINNPLKLIVVPQCCPLVDIVLMVCNPCQTCYPPTTLTLTLAYPIADPDFELVCGSTTLYTPDSETANTGLNLIPIPGGLQIQAQIPQIKAGGSSFVKFRLKALAPTAQATVATLTGVFSDGTPIKTGCPDETPIDDRIIAMATKPVLLNCSGDGRDTRPCAIT